MWGVSWSEREQKDEKKLHKAKLCVQISWLLLNTISTCVICCVVFFSWKNKLEMMQRFLDAGYYSANLPLWTVITKSFCWDLARQIVLCQICLLFAPAFKIFINFSLDDRCWEDRDRSIALSWFLLKTTFSKKWLTES